MILTLFKLNYSMLIIRVDEIFYVEISQAAVGFEYEGKTEKHESQKGENSLWVKSGWLIMHRFTTVFSMFHAQKLNRIWLNEVLAKLISQQG